MENPADKRQRIWQTLAAVPRGRVVTYGQLATLAGLPGHARYVGTCLKQLPPGSTLPWHRVINAAGAISFAEQTPNHQRQRSLLEAEGIRLQAGRIDLKRYRWAP
ncbi:MGMT family protein [Motiliproteus sp. SC1-56]|uniref:MGMT family protein n=1 Tax=Motiliproteus sp. SC1-56 TaxID=2799565 RepID=UPI001A8C4660